MKRLQDKDYENYDHDSRIESRGPKRLKPEEIDCLAPYQYMCDGFLTWECGRCGKEHATRMFRTAGLVVQCGRGFALYPHPVQGGDPLPEKKTGMRYEGGCGARNLLVRTNCLEINEVLQRKWKQDEIAKENERLKGIVRYNEEVLGKIVRFLKIDMEKALEDSLYHLKSSIETEMKKAAGADGEKA
jgi:hypothetical protein